MLLIETDKSKQTIPYDEIYKNANLYRLHQDNLRWTLFGGAIAYYAVVFNLSSQFSSRLAIPIILIGICYSFIIAIENFYYNLFAEYVDDCETKLIKGDKLDTLKEYSNKKADNISPFHYSFFFGMLIIEIGNMALSYYYCSGATRISICIINGITFVVIVFFWKYFYKYFLTLLKIITDWTNNIKKGK